MRSQLPIPDDWNQQEDGYMFFIACVPNSPLWRAIARGQFYNLTRGRTWDADTGIITEAQAIAWEIFGSICMANCDDLILQLTRIADALEAIAPGGDGSLEPKLDDVEELLQQLVKDIGGVTVVLSEGSVQ